MSSTVTNSVLYLFWIDKDFTPTIAESLYMSFHGRRVDEVLDMPNSEIRRILQVNHELKRNHIQMVIYAVEEERERRSEWPSWPSSSMVNSYFV